MATLVAVWGGTSREMGRLRRAIDEYCTCQHDPATCAAPHSLLTNQKSLDHLLFALRIRERFIWREHNNEP